MKNLETVPFEKLIAWLEGQLSDEEAAEIEAKVAAADPTTEANLRWLKGWQQMSSTVVLAAPPEELHRRLVKDFIIHRRRRGAEALLQRLLATLSFDSWAQPATAGLRSATAQGQERQLVFSTDAADVALNIQPPTADQRFQLMGQILPVDGDSAPGIYSVQLLREASEVAITTTDELGEFSFDSVPSGVYEIIMSSDEVELILTPVKVHS